MDTINGLHILYPSLPYLEIVKQYNVGQFITSRPWNAMGATNISLYPFAIGLAFFVPLDLSFSCWFFFVLRKLFQVFGSVAGLDGPGSQGFPYFEQQASGAWIAWGLTIAWALRKQFRQAWNIAWKEEARITDGQYSNPAFLAASSASSQARQYRAAFIGIAVGSAILAAYSAKIGLTPWVALLFFGLYFLLALTLTRVRAELGTPHEIYFVNPRLILVTLFGSQAIGAQSLTALSAMYWFNRGYRCHPMPNQLEAMKMGDTARIRQSSILTVLIIAFAWGTLCAYWANLHVTFAEGAAAKAVGFKRWVGAESYERLQGWLNTPTRVNPTQLLYVAGGFLLVIFLRGMRGSFLVVAVPSRRVRSRRLFRDGLLLVLLLRGVGGKGDPGALRRHEDLQRGHSVLPGPDSRRLHHRLAVGAVRPAPASANLQNLYLSSFVHNDSK